jgi:regulatory protein
VSQALGAAGIGEDIRAAFHADRGAHRRAALAMARRRGFGPFGQGGIDRAAREKQIAAMLRAGHGLDSARELVDAASVEAAEDWAAQAAKDEACD